jgi:hypothetical protein
MTENEILVASRLFQSANPDVARKLSAVRARVRSFTAGQMIFEAGEAGDAVFVLTGAREGVRSGLSASSGAMSSARQSFSPRGSIRRPASGRPPRVH